MPGAASASASLVLLEGKKEQLDDFNSLTGTLASGNVQRSRREGAMERQMERDKATAFNGQESSYFLGTFSPVCSQGSFV